MVLAILREGATASSLAAEIHLNLLILCDDQYFDAATVPPAGAVYPRLRHVVLDEAIAAGAFVDEQDHDLFIFVFDTSVCVERLNRHLGIHELHSAFTLRSVQDRARVHRSMLDSTIFNNAKKGLVRLRDHLRDNYAAEVASFIDKPFFAYAEYPKV
jgi:hypothetical protein